MSSRPKSLLLEYDAWEPTVDKHEYQWQLRLLQSGWRIENGLPARQDGPKTRGAELPVLYAERTLANYLTPTIRRVVRQEVLDSTRSHGKLYGKPRIFNHLLSSQPLCFNLFAELRDDLKLASQTLADMSHGRLAQVTGIDFEYSPGRGDERYTGDRSAFDVYVQFRNVEGGRGFLAIEVKYHENLEPERNEYRPRYDEVAASMGCFRIDALQPLRQAGPLQQMWRDHLLAGAHANVDAFDDAIFVFLYPEANTACVGAVDAYHACLTDHRTFQAWTLDALVRNLMTRTDASWVRQFHKRYLDFDSLPGTETAPSIAKRDAPR